MVEHYYSEKQTSKFKLDKLEISVFGNDFTVYVSGGVFSKRKLDKGTKLLIENAIIKENWNLLDLGCGYGVVGISLKIEYPLVNVVMSDVNERAVGLAKKNVALNKLDVAVFHSDVFSNESLVKGKYDSILLNPPQTAGRKVCFQMIEESKEYLVVGGLLQLVARHNKGGKVLSEKMKEVFGNVRDAVKKGGFRVYVSEKK